MVSYFVPRGRFLLKAGNLRQVIQQQQQQQTKHTAQQNGKWPVLRHFRQSSTKPNAVSHSKESPSQARQDMINNNNTLERAQPKPKQKQQKSDQNLLEVQRNAFWRWTGFLLRWAPMGICVFGAIEWQWHKRRCHHENTPRTASEFQSRVYCSLPLRIISRCWGWLAACYMPEPLRPYVYGWYSSTFNVNINEALYPDYGHYSSLAQFFTRPLKEGARTIDSQAPLVSPADGKVLHFGSAADTLIEQVKGVNYSIEDFLGPLQESAAAEKSSAVSYAQAIKQKRDGSTELFQCVIYLAPGDYHRFHSPTAWQPQVRRHFSGELLSVNPKVANWLPGLFCLNERVLYMGNWKYGFFSYTAVGATNVGSVEIYMDADLKTNRWTGLKMGAHPPSTYEYDELQLNTQEQEQLKFDKGELVGQFNMGSTIVLLFEAPKNFKFDIIAGQKIRVGDSLGHIVE
ncbi:phosphatidylserine decarboxylase proenzyme, mitochondrial [Scaptodrosophila lebanonensis]|uniref:Phosphatidylserine decarboxylase proenzyme, mitochondrial n=1 Tax=Drosophila lebanonensis TaxID=7225 RepID=A0A6J2T436_DROLE|nr:phosphatidylserine decarboxylase proenzyme, mitochondrial [Scaptodrosophila lebanonensis]